jgi:hypothetical protein
LKAAFPGALAGSRRAGGLFIATLLLETATGMKMKTRQAIRDLTAYTWGLQKKTIPALAILRDFRVGYGHEGPLPKNPEVASFHYDGQVHFNLANEILDDTRIIEEGENKAVALQISTDSVQSDLAIAKQHLWSDSTEGRTDGRYLHRLISCFYHRVF